MGAGLEPLVGPLGAGAVVGARPPADGAEWAIEDPTGSGRSRRGRAAAKGRTSRGRAEALATGLTERTESLRRWAAMSSWSGRSGLRNFKPATRPALRPKTLMGSVIVFLISS